MSWLMAVTPWLILVPYEAVGTPGERHWNDHLRARMAEDTGCCATVDTRACSLSVDPPDEETFESQTGPLCWRWAAGTRLPSQLERFPSGYSEWSQGWCGSQLSLLREDQIAASQWALNAVPLT